MKVRRWPLGLFTSIVFFVLLTSHINLAYATSAWLSDYNVVQGQITSVSWSGFSGSVNIVVYKGSNFWVYANTTASGSGSQNLDTTGWELRSDYGIKIELKSDTSVYQYTGNLSVSKPSVSLSDYDVTLGKSTWVSWSGFSGDANLLLYKGNKFLVYANTTALGTGSQGLNTTGWEPGSDYWIRAELKTDTSIYADTPYFLVTQPLVPIVNIITPSSGSVWNKVTDYRITWNWVNYSGNIRIHVYLNDSYYKTISANEPVTNGIAGVVFNAPQNWPTSDYYEIKISTLDDKASDTSGYFTLADTISIPNSPPVIDSFEVDQTFGPIPLQVSFTCISHDTDGIITGYTLDPGVGGTPVTNQTGFFTHIYNTAGIYQTSCKVMDDFGDVVISGPINMVISALKEEPNDFIYPVLGISQTDPLKNKSDPLIDGWSGKGIGQVSAKPGHLGQDYFLKKGDSAGKPVYAIADGEIVEVLNGPGKYGWCDNNDHGWGPVVVIKHERSSGFTISDSAVVDSGGCGTNRNPTVIYSLYGHLSKESIKSLYIAQRVRKGDLIGTIGKYGVDQISWKKNHLHHEIKDEGGFLEGAWYKGNRGKCPGSSNQACEVKGVGTGYSYKNGFAPHRYVPNIFIPDNAK